MQHELALLIPLAPFMIAGLAIWTRHQRRMAELQMGAAAEKAALAATRNTELEERVRVLERIVTDKGYDVATQIEALRDARSVADRLGRDAKAVEEAERPSVFPQTRQ